jgi:hypothetical protein
VELVLEVGGGYPFFLQTAGYFAFDRQIEGEDMGEEERKLFLETVTTQFTGHFKSYWQKLKPQGRYVLAALPLVMDDFAYQETIARLSDQCLIKKRDGRYDYFSPLLEAFVRRQVVQGLLQAGPLLVDQRREEVLLRGEPLSLSPTNYTLLTILMQQAGRVVTRDELWRSAWSGDPHDAAQQLKSSIKSLRNDLGSDGDCIVNRRGVGYIFSPNSADR